MLSLMGLGLVVSIAGFFAVQSREDYLARDDFEQTAKDKVSEIKNDFEANLEVLHSLRSANFRTHVSIPETLIPEGNNSRVSGDGLVSAVKAVSMSRP